MFSLINNLSKIWKWNQKEIIYEVRSLRIKPITFSIIYSHLLEKPAQAEKILLLQNPLMHTK